MEEHETENKSTVNTTMFYEWLLCHMECTWRCCSNNFTISVVFTVQLFDQIELVAVSDWGQSDIDSSPT